jgi:A/G-specific adenine glycosylase
MDYGTILKKQVVNPSRKSKHYTKQSTFEGSERQLRGKVLKLFTKKQSYSRTQLQEACNDSRLDTVLQQLIKEGFLREAKGTYTLASL